MDQDQMLQDWGGYEPETQKALRVVAQLAGEGTAKQMAGAIAREYVKRDLDITLLEQTKKQKQQLTFNDIRVLKIAERWGGDLDRAIQFSRLDINEFFTCIDNLVKQKYLRGDVRFGYRRTSKPLPRRAKTLTEWEITTIVDDWIAQHPQAFIDEKQRNLMIRTHMIIQEKTPGYTL